MTFETVNTGIGYSLQQQLALRSVVIKQLLINICVAESNGIVCVDEQSVSCCSDISLIFI